MFVTYIKVIIKNNKVMIETICKVFYRDSVESTCKAVMVFDFNLEDKDVIKKIAEYLEDEEMDDDEYCTLQTKEDCIEAATNIVNGDLLDLDLDKYYIEEVDLFKNV